MNTMIKIMILFLAGLLLFSCKKDDFSIMEREQTLAMNAPVNKEIRELKERLETAEDDSERGNINSQIADIYSDKGDVVSALSSASDAVKYQPNDYMARYLLGKSYVDSGRYDEAITELKLSISYNNKFAPSHFELGNAYYKKYVLTDAMKHYRIAIRIDPKHLRAYSNLGVLQSVSGNLKEAERSFKKIIEIDPKFSVTYKNLGILYDTRLKNKEQASVHYKKYLELAPDSPDRQLVKAWIQVIGD